MHSCEHCLLPLPAGPAIRENDDGREIFFCCPGCRGVYRLLRSHGLTEFYRRRTGWIPGPPEPAEADVEGIAETITDREGEKEAVLVISGIRCASCAWLIERYLGGKPGVTHARVNYATGRAVVRWDPGKVGIADIGSWIRELGYTAHPSGSGAAEEALGREKRDHLLRFGTAAFLSMQVMTFTAGLYAGYFQGIEPGYETAFKLIALVLTTPVIFYAGQPLLRGAIAGLRNRTLGMDVLVFLGAFSAYAYSAAAILTGGEVYFDTAGMIITLILLGRYIEAAVRSRARESIARLERLAPRLAWRRISGDPSPVRRTERVSASILRIGDVIEVLPGERIPADGRVVEGESETDDSLLTGEAAPVPKKKGSGAFAGTLNGTGRLVLLVTQTGGETLLSRIRDAVEEAQGRNAPIQRVADKVVGRFVPAVIALAVLAIVVRLANGDDAVHALMASISVLVVACPCALGLATPLAVLVGFAAARTRGILVRGGDVLEAGAFVTDVFLDKTGTLTEGRPRLADVIGFGMPPEAVARLAASLEAPSEHALSRAIRESVPRETLLPVEGFLAHAGMGVEGIVEGKKLFLGHPGLMAARGIPVTPEQERRYSDLSEETKTAVFLADGKQVLGLLSTVDALRRDAPDAVRLLGECGCRVLLLTGDSDPVARRLAGEAGIVAVLSRVTPVEKAEMVRDKKRFGCRVMMVGDGVNDAPALAEADVGVAMGRGTDIARESADVILMNDDLLLIPRFLTLSRKTMRVIRQNLAWAFSYNAVAIPLAVAGVLHPIVSAALMSASSLAVVGNSLRLKKG